MPNIKGKQLMVLAKVPISSGAYASRTIAYATNHTLSAGSNLGDVATKDDNELYVNQEVTSQNWSLTTENLIAADINDEGMPTYGDLLSLMKAGDAVQVYFETLPGAMGTERVGTNWNDPGNTTNEREILIGKAYITSLELNAQNRENASYTATFTGAGKPTIADPSTLSTVSTSSAKKTDESATTESDAA